MDITNKKGGTVRLKCPECHGEVLYKRETVMALLNVTSLDRRHEVKVVYLTCQKNHTHRYEV